MSNERYHQDLAEQLTTGQLSLFIGADLPSEITGVPSRSDLARELAQRYGLDESLSLAEVAQRVARGSNRFEFTAFIRAALGRSNLSTQPFHRRIVDLVKTYQLETIIATVYDDRLERAFQEQSAGLNRAVRGSDIHFLQPDLPTLIKLYGDAQQVDTLIVTDRDHSDLLRDREKEALIDEVRRTFRRHTMLFLGYNLADPDFRFLFDQIAESRFARTAYAVWRGLSEADIAMWRDRGIAILERDPWGILLEQGNLNEPMGTLNKETAVITQLITIQNQLIDTYNADCLTMLCFDNFPSVYKKFDLRLNQEQKVQRLVEYCYHQNRLDQMVMLLKRNLPNRMGK